MRTPALQREAIAQAVAFHGSLCPGLALGIKAAEIAIDKLGAGPGDLVAFVESDICAVDGVQAMTGCTLGNRNLILRDWGKIAFTFWHRSNGRALRIHGGPAWDPTYQALRKKVSAGDATAVEVELLEEMTEIEANSVLAADPYALFALEVVSAPVPRTSQVDPWVFCAVCEEHVMETRTRRVRGQTVCIPCFETLRAAA
jgi:formylmethanofuran dehydrogenase subunit E